MRGLESLTAALAEVLARGGGAGEGGRARKLVDGRGIGKPPVFDKETNFVIWTRKVESYVASVYDQARQILPWCVESTERTGREDACIRFGGDATSYKEFDDDLFGCLLALTDAEGFDLVANGPRGEGMEVWRRLHRR